MELYEKHRPRSLDQVVGQPAAVAKCRSLLSAGLGGKALWISGPSGAGKTTLARILAVAHAGGEIVEFASADTFGADQLRELEGQRRLRPLWPMAYIVNEAHALRAPVVRGLLGVLEGLPEWLLVIFTTTREGQEKLFEDNIEEAPLLSRCHEVKLTSQGLCKAFAEHVRGIALAEGLDGMPIEAYERLMKTVKNNCRAALQRVAAGDMRA